MINFLISGWYLSCFLIYNVPSGVGEPGGEPRRLPHQRLSVQSGRLCPHQPLGAENTSLRHQENSGSVQWDIYPGPVQPGGWGLWLFTCSRSLLRGRQGGSDPVERSSDSPASEQDAASQLPGDGLLHRHQYPVLPQTADKLRGKGLSEKVRFHSELTRSLVWVYFSVIEAY